MVNGDRWDLVPIEDSEERRGKGQVVGVREDVVDKDEVGLAFDYHLLNFLPHTSLEIVENGEHNVLVEHLVVERVVAQERVITFFEIEEGDDVGVFSMESVVAGEIFDRVPQLF